MFAEIAGSPPETTGTIKAFYGIPANVPAGWHLCDGTNGTPDFRNKFVVGAGSVYDVGETGGSGIHNHIGSFESHQHRLALYPNVATGADKYASPYPNTEVKAGTISTMTSSHIPPFIGLYWIIKL